MCAQNWPQYRHSWCTARPRAQRLGPASSLSWSLTGVTAARAGRHHPRRARSRGPRQTRAKRVPCEARPGGGRRVAPSGPGPSTCSRACEHDVSMSLSCIVRITFVILVSAVGSRWPTTTVCLLALQLSLPWRRTPAPPQPTSSRVRDWQIPTLC